MKYLGKRKLYEMIGKLANYAEMPKCVDCSYMSHGGYEWLRFWLSDYSKRVEFTVYKSGVYVRIEEFDEYGEQLRNEFISNLSLAMRIGKPICSPSD